MLKSLVVLRAPPPWLYYNVAPYLFGFAGKMAREAPRQVLMITVILPRVAGPLLTLRFVDPSLRADPAFLLPRAQHPLESRGTCDDLTVEACLGKQHITPKGNKRGCIASQMCTLSEVGAEDGPVPFGDSCLQLAGQQGPVTTHVCVRGLW